MEKQYCSIHHLYYTSNQCPCCVADRSNYLAQRYYVAPVELTTKKEKEPTEEDLEALVAKFNMR